MDRAVRGTYALAAKLPAVASGRAIGVSETQIQIPDPGSQAPGGPYRNLWVPLVVIPAGIVMVLVLVFALFGAIAGDEASPASNLERVVNGGSNEREQALYSLVTQLGENHRAQSEGRPPPHELDPGFLDDVEAAADELGDESPQIRLTLGILLATSKDPEGARILAQLLELDDEADPERRTRFYALLNLGLVRDASTSAAILPFLTHDDPGLRTVAAGALQGALDERGRAGLALALEDPVFEVRMTAAISLSKLDPPDLRAAPVLREGLSAERYAEENARDRERYRRADLVSDVRVKLVRALARLGPLEEDGERLRALQSDPDLRVAAEAREALTEAAGGGQ